MLKEEKTFLFAFANFIAAFGGGMILGKGVQIINLSYLQGGSIFAFFIGTVIGLIFLQFIPTQISELFARWFSICGGMTSLCLIVLFNHYALNGVLSGIAAFIFFILLSIRFGFWFYSRVKRVANVAGLQQKIAWVELGYYTGIILGLILWEFFSIDIGFVYVLALDACLQLSAGILDLYGSKIDIKKLELSHQSGDNLQTTSKTIYEPEWGWRLAIAVIFLTVGVQAIIFNLAHHIPAYFRSYMLAVFYFGVSVGAFFCKTFNIYLNWNSGTHSAEICFTNSHNQLKLNLSAMVIVSGFSVAMVVMWAHGYWLGNIKTITNFTELLIGLFVFIAAFFYEILALAILDRIGLEEKHSINRNMIMRTYGLMGIGAAVSFWLMGITNSLFFGLFVILIVSTLTATLAILKRNFTLLTVS